MISGEEEWTLNSGTAMGIDGIPSLMVNTTSCFSGLDTRTDVEGNIIPEYGIRGVISFTTPSVYTQTIIGLQ